ncbi:MAG: hypothetical protein R2771_02020 [Saprospiraceae bacterium]
MQEVHQLKVFSGRYAILQEGEGFKVSNENWVLSILGLVEIGEFDSKVWEFLLLMEMMVHDDGGVYMVVLDLRNDVVKLSVKPAEVYGIGDC